MKHYRKLTPFNLAKSASVFLSASLFLGSPLAAQNSAIGPLRTCVVSHETPQGSWIASRTLTVTANDVRAGRDEYLWEPKTKQSFGPGQTMSWNLSYYWAPEIATQARISDDDVMVSLYFRFEPQPNLGTLRKPAFTSFHLFRTADPSSERLSKRTSLTDFMLWTQSSNGELNTKAVISLSEILAYGAGLEALAWNIQMPPNEFGGTNQVAKGVFPIAAIRNKTAKILELRQLLNRKAANFRTQCDAPITATAAN